MQQTGLPALLGRLGLRFDPTAAMYMLFNFITSVGIVFANKVVFKTFGYNYATLMTAFHFFVTCGGLLINKQLGMYQVKKLSHWDVLPITVSFCAFVVFNNLSLQYNTVGFYQLMKVLTTPVVVVLQNVVYKVDLPRVLKLSLVPICLGVAMATVNDVSFNAVGTFWAVAGLVATAFYQLLVKTRQDKLEANSFQLLHYQAPQSALFVTVCTPFFDQTFGPQGFLQYRYSFGAIFAIALSCVLAYCVNLSTYLVIGRTSPVSYQVLGHFKLLVILSAGVLLMGEDRNPWRLCGMLLAFGGIVAYTTLRQNLASEWAQRSKKQAGEQGVPLKQFEGRAVEGEDGEEDEGGRKGMQSLEMDEEESCKREVQ